MSDRDSKIEISQKFNLKLYDRADLPKFLI